MGLFQRKLLHCIFRGGGGGPTFSRGGPNAISIETHISCDNPGRGPDPLSPLWIRT